MRLTKRMSCDMVNDRLCVFDLEYRPGSGPCGKPPSHGLQLSEVEIKLHG